MRYGVLILVCGLGGLAVHSAAQNLTSAGNNWVRSDGDPGATRYSTLTQITTSNVNSLARAWTFHTNSGRFAGAPMIVDNVMYFSAPNGVYALDATTGALLWRYPAAVPAAPLPASAETTGAAPQGRGAAPDPGRMGTPPPAVAGAGGGGAGRGAGRGGGFATVGSALFGEAQAGRGAGRGGADAAGTASRGPTYWEGTTGVAPRIFSLLTGGLAAIDAKTGTIVRTFGENGFLPEITSMSPPVIFKSMLITKGPTERGKGVTVKGFDIVSGQPRWTFYTKAQPGDPNRGTWLRDSADTEASPNIWGMFSVDEQRGLVFIPIERTEGNGGNDYWAGGNPGNTLYSQSLVALDAMTGKMKWFQQLVHHDIWDYDLAAAPVLVDVRRNGQVIPAVVETTKMGLMFIFHRETGEPIFGMEERPVPQTTVPGEWTSPTQPFPVKPEPLSRNSFKQSDLSTVTPEHQAFCRDLWDTNKLSDTMPYTPWKLGENVLVMPGAQGGSNFWGATFNRSLGLIIANVHDAGQWGMLRISTGRRGGGEAAPAAGNTPPPGATAPPVTGPVSYSKVPGPASRFWDTAKEWSCTQPPWGQLVAVNANTGDIAWRVPLGSFPELEAKGIKSGTPNSGGAITTAGNLVFIGATVDGYFRAFDARNGAELWRDKLPTPAHSTPATYMGRDGRQYVVIGANGGGFFGAPTFDDVIAYALPSAATGPGRGGRR